MDVPLVAAGCLAVVAAGVHGVAGEIAVVRRLSPAMLPPSRFGGPRTTKSMIRVTWHMTTYAFLAAGAGLLAAGSVVGGDMGRGIAVAAAGAVTGFAAVAAGLGSAGRSPRSLVRHPAPALLTATAVLAWWGAL